MQIPPSFLRVSFVVVAVLWAVSAAAPAASAESSRPTVLTSEYDDADAGREGAKGVEAQIGVLDDPELNAYVNAIGLRLLRALPRRSFQYRFRVVDQVEPNAFALPGGYIFISRGLLALANNEDELACVIGHEIGHVAKRHAAARQGVQRGQPPFVMGWLRMGQMAAYARDLERSADRDGQILCAAAGYDPRGLATFLESLTRDEKRRTGYSRNASFFDTHPSSSRRSSIASIQASELRWKRNKEIGDPRASLLARLEGLPIGQRPETGVFRGDVFLHPDLDFKLRFPRRWNKANTNDTVGAQAPRGDAIVFLTGDVPPGEPREVAEAWVEHGHAEPGRVRNSGPFTVGRIPAWQLEISAATGGALMRSYVTFIPKGGSTWRITGVAVSDKELKRTVATTRSFRGLSDEDRANLKSTRLHIVEAKSGEDFAALTQRTGNVWTTFDTATTNGLKTKHRFEGGELVKIAREHAYTPQPKRAPEGS